LSAESGKAFRNPPYFPLSMLILPIVAYKPFMRVIGAYKH